MKDLQKLTDFPIESATLIISESAIKLAQATEYAMHLRSSLQDLIGIEDDEAFMSSIQDSEDNVSSFLKSCKDYASVIYEQRSPITKAMDAIRKNFTEVEGEFNGNSGEIQALNSARITLLNRVNGIKERKRIEAERKANVARELQTVSLSAKSFCEGYAYSNEECEFDSFVTYVHNYFNPRYIDRTAIYGVLSSWWNNDGGAEYASELFANKSAPDAQQVEEVNIEEVISDNSAISHLTISVPEVTVDFAKDIKTAVVVAVLSAEGYAKLFSAWFSDEGKTLTVDELSRFKLSSLLVWAKRQYKVGVIIDDASISYKTTAK